MYIFSGTFQKMCFILLFLQLCGETYGTAMTLLNDVHHSVWEKEWASERARENTLPIMWLWHARSTLSYNVGCHHALTWVSQETVISQKSVTWHQKLQKRSAWQLMPAGKSHYKRFSSFIFRHGVMMYPYEHLWMLTKSFPVISVV